jgi:hypothetical protein
VVLGSVATVACGGDDPGGETGAGTSAVDPQVDATYQAVDTAIGKAQVPLCPPGEHSSAPLVTGSAAAAHFRYLDGRIYELGPCALPLEERGELRVYRYADEALRDAAAESSLDRNPRPAFMWTSGESLLVEEWLFDPAEPDAGFEEVAGDAHDAVSGLEDTRGVS